MGRDEMNEVAENVVRENPPAYGWWPKVVEKTGQPVKQKGIQY